MAVPSHSKDKGWAWMVLFSSFLVNIITLGIAFSVGVYFVVFLEEFKQSKSITAWVMSLNSGCMFLSGPIGSMLTNRYGFRVVTVIGGLLASVGFLTSMFANNIYLLYLTFGVMLGTGLGLSYVPSVGVLAYYFEKRRSFAMAFSTVGSGLGTFICSPMLYYFIVTYGWKGSMLINSGIVLNIVVCGAVLRPVNAPKTSKLSGILQTDLLKEINFYVFFGHCFFMHGVYIFLVIINEFVIEKGLTLADSPYVVAAFGCGNVSGRLLVSVLGNYQKLTEFYQFLILNAATCLHGAIMYLFLCGNSFPIFLGLAVFTGFFFGLKFALVPPTTAVLFGASRMTSAYGYMMFATGLSGVIGPLTAGLLTDVTQTVNTAMLLAASFIMSSFILVLSISWMRYKMYQRTSKKQQEEMKKAEETLIQSNGQIAAATEEMGTV